MMSVWLATGPAPARHAVPFRPGVSYDTVVVGAGLTGVISALLLAKAGQRVALVEALLPGAGATGNITGRMSLLQGATLSKVRRHQGDGWLQAWVAGHRSCQAWLARELASAGIEHQRSTAYTYATTVEGLRTLEREAAAARVGGIDVDWSLDPGLPFAVAGAIAVRGEVQFHPMQVLAGLLDRFAGLGGVLHVGCPVQGVTVASGCDVFTPHGLIRADQVVVATGTPMVSRGAHLARLKILRSDAIACRVDGPLPRGTYLSVDEPLRSLRTVSTPDGVLLMVGDSGRLEADNWDSSARTSELDAWTQARFPGATRTHAWSAREYRSANSLPYVGRLVGSRGRVLMATAYDKWGISDGVAAAVRMAGEITGNPPAWAVRLTSSAGQHAVNDALSFAVGI